MQGLIVLQSGQPYSVIDYSGAVGSIYYGLNDGITNPIVPLAPGCTPKNAVTGAIGNDPGLPALKASCFTVPLLSKCAVAIQASAAQIGRVVMNLITCAAEITGIIRSLDL